MNMAMTQTSASFYENNHKFEHSKKKCVECGFDSLSPGYLLLKKKHVKPHHFDILHTSHVPRTHYSDFFFRSPIDSLSIPIDAVISCV